MLKGVDMAVSEGESVAIVGVSGAGKSTLLHILGGLQKPDEGGVELDGVNVYGAGKSVRARLRATCAGFVFQSYHLLPEMDVMENVMLPGMALRGNGARGRERARALLETVGMLHRAGHVPQELSGGEQQRVALARALMNRPKLVLADEPTGNLDAETGDLVLNLLLGLAGGGTHALVMVTHSERVAARCDRILHLRDGVLEEMSHA